MVVSLGCLRPSQYLLCCSVCKNAFKQEKWWYAEALETAVCDSSFRDWSCTSWRGKIQASRQHSRKCCPEGDHTGFHERQREPLGIRQGQLSPKRWQKHLAARAVRRINPLLPIQVAPMPLPWRRLPPTPLTARSRKGKHVWARVWEGRGFLKPHNLFPNVYFAFSWSYSQISFYESFLIFWLSIGTMADDHRLRPGFFCVVTSYS